MSVEMKVPPVGESINEVTLSSWLKNDGDYVEMDEVIAEMESDKATFELTAEKAGILHIKAQEGETIPVGTLVCIIEESEAPAEEASSGKDSGKSSNERSEEHTSELHSLMRISYAVFCLKKKNKNHII